MNYLSMLLFGLAYAAMYIYPIIALIQITDAFLKYLQKGKPVVFYRDLERYALMILGYIIGMWLFIQILNDVASGTILDTWFAIYFLLVPIMIGMYKRRINKIEYFEQIEKLIF